MKIFKKKTRKLSKNDKSVRNKNKNLFILLKFYLFNEITIKLPVVFFSDKEQKTMKKSQICNMPQQRYSQFKGFCFFQWLTRLKKAYVMITCNFLMKYQVLQSIICKYYPSHKNSGLHGLFINGRKHKWL